MLTQFITSVSNEKLKMLKSLLSAKGIKEHNKFILSGEKLLHEFLSQRLTRFKPYAVVFDSENWPVAIEKNSEIQKIVIPKEVFRDLDVIGTHAPLLVLEFKDFEIKDLTVAPMELELICPLGDPRNLGALIRSAVGLGVHEIILTQEAAHPYLPQSVKASAGAVLYAHFKKTEAPLNELPVVSENYALHLEGLDITKISWPKNLRLWVGEEGPGMNLTSEQKKKLKFITISTQRIESLNAMVSTTLAIWEWKKNQN